MREKIIAANASGEHRSAAERRQKSHLKVRAYEDEEDRGKQFKLIFFLNKQLKRKKKNFHNYTII